MNEKNTDHLLKLIDDLIKLVGKNVDNINKLAEEVEDLYDVDRKLINYALDYIPIKELKKIFARYK